MSELLLLLLREVLLVGQGCVGAVSLALRSVHCAFDKVGMPAPIKDG